MKCDRYSALKFVIEVEEAATAHDRGVEVIDQELCDGAFETDSTGRD